MSSQGKKAARDQARRQAARRRQRLRLGAMVAVVVLVVGVTTVLVLTDSEPDELAAVVEIPNLGQGHLAQGEAPPSYNSNPPTSGRHAPASAECGIYVEEIPDEVQVHNLEHGTVMIQYRADLAESDRSALWEYARSKSSHILVAPRERLETAVAVTAWTRLLPLDAVELDIIDAFYGRFAQRGPELGVACPFTVDQPLG